MRGAKEDVEALLNSGLSFAEEMLKKHGEFFPFGRAMRSDGEIVAIESFDGRELPPSNDIIELISAGLRQDAVNCKNIATALVYDARVFPPGQGSKSDAMVVELEHRDNYAVTVFLPYRIKDGKLELGTLFATPARRGIFNSPSR